MKVTLVLTFLLFTGCASTSKRWERSERIQYHQIEQSKVVNGDQLYYPSIYIPLVWGTF